MQDIVASDAARVLRSMGNTYSGWTCSAVYKVMKGTFSLALRRGIITRNPMDGLAPSERPKQKNKRKIYVVCDAEMERLIAAASTERWKAAVGLAGYAGLRLGEVRGLRWGDIDFDANVVYVRRSLLPDGMPVPTKSEAGNRPIPMVPALRRALLTWKVRSPTPLPRITSSSRRVECM